MPVVERNLLIIDGQTTTSCWSGYGATVITGSFTFTKAAETENAENLLVIDRKPKIAAAYAKNFEKHPGHSRPFKQRSSARGTSL